MLGFSARRIARFDEESETDARTRTFSLVDDPASRLLPTR
jgi:hypothetical protein